MAKTVRVRIAVAVDPAGDWSSAGFKGWSDKNAMMAAAEPLEEGERRYWIEADLEVPEIQTIQGVTIND